MSRGKCVRDAGVEPNNDGSLKRIGLRDNELESRKSLELNLVVIAEATSPIKKDLPGE
jgi:hypothetical protein